MRISRRLRICAGREGGFSLGEVLIAGFILSLAVFPMVGMFDGAYLVARQATNINLSNDCLRMYSEKVITLPFYVDHKEGDLSQNLDVDDYYWGTRSPVYNNAWSAAPQVLMKAYGVEPYPNMEVYVKMAYIDDEKVSGTTLEQAADATRLAETWQPKALYGYDRPKTKEGKNLTLILYQVTVNTNTGQTFSNLDLYTSPTDVVANVYLDRVINVSADATKLGTRFNEYGNCISAPHNKDSITIRAYGEGFTAADVAAGKVVVKLVRLGGDSDISLSGLTFGTDGDMRYLQGTINLNSAGLVQPYAPRKMPGYWYAWLVVNHVISVKTNAFVVEYPQPVWHPDYSDSSGDKRGEESTTDEVLTFTNLDYVMNFVTGAYPNPGIGAVVQLVHTTLDPSGKPIDQINGTGLSISPAVNNGYQTGLTVTAHFKFVGHVGGKYKVRVINCVDRATPDIRVMGNTYFDLDDEPLYYDLEGPPAVNEVYVYEAAPLTAFPRHFAYDDRDYAYTLEIKGYNFDDLISSSMVTLGLGGDTNVDPPSGATNEVQPLSVNRIDSQTLRAVFDFRDEVSDSQRGAYWLHVKNSNDFGRVLQPAFDIREPRPIVYSYAVNTLGLWQNYWNVGVGAVGECFDVDPASGRDVEVRIKEAANPANDLEATQSMDAKTVSQEGRALDCKLNLIGCEAGDWQFYVRSTAAGNPTDNGYVDIINAQEYTSLMAVGVGAPALLTADVPAAGEPASIRVSSRYRNWKKDDGWRAWRSWVVEDEGNGARAQVFEDDEGYGNSDNSTQGEMYFVQLKGMGFNIGTVTINCVNDHGENTDGMNATWANVPVVYDRAGLSVMIAMSEADAKITGPHMDDKGKENPISLRVRNNATGTWSVWYVDRIGVKMGPSYQ